MAEYKGHTIAEVPFEGTFDNYESYGFKVDKAYTVVDELGEPLPILQNLFWSPSDAAQAIDAVNWLTARVDKSVTRWPPTVVFEHNQMMGYRRNFALVFETLKAIEDMCREARDLDENPREAILDKLQLLRLGASR